VLPFLTLALYFGLGLNQAAPAEDRIRDEAARWLGGPLAHIPGETKLSLVRLVHRTPGTARGLTNETFRDKLYLEVLLNSGREEEHPAGQSAPAVDRMKAVGSLAESRLIPILLEYAAVLGEVPGVYGIKLLLIELPANSFIQLYAPLELINGVRSGKVSRQMLLDGSVVFINNDIVRLRL
jgi:hypothetical protein